MALADLIARLEHDADARIAELTAKAEAEARSLFAEASRVKETLRTTELGRRRARRQARLERELADARARARAQVLEARHAVLARIFAQARERLPALGASERWAAVLPHHLEHALRYVEGQRVIVKCAPQLTPLVRQHLTGRDTVTVVEDPQTPAGFVVTTADEGVVIDQTLAARLTRSEQRLAVELMARVSP
ncbi:MAG: V-type ATP synthase subunit E [Myxococcaceae bacterium]